MLQALKDAFAWLLGFIAEAGQTVLDGAISGLQASGVPTSYLNPIVAWKNQLDYVFPLSETVTMSIALLALYTAVRAVRWIIKLIPTLG